MGRSARKSSRQHHSIVGFSRTRSAPRPPQRSWCAAATTRPLASRRIRARSSCSPSGTAAREPRLDRAGRRLRLRPAPSRLPPDAACCLCVARTRNKLDVYRLSRGMSDPQPIFVKRLAQPRQHPLAPVREHPACAPDGRLVYVSNRAFDTVEFDGKSSFPVARTTSRCFRSLPRPASRRRSSTRTCAASSRTSRSILPRACLSWPTSNPRLIRDGARFKTVPANLGTYHVGPDGKLTFARSYDVDTGNASQFLERGRGIRIATVFSSEACPRT